MIPKRKIILIWRETRENAFKMFRLSAKGMEGKMDKGEGTRGKGKGEGSTRNVWGDYTNLRLNLISSIFDLNNM